MALGPPLRGVSWPGPRHPPVGVTIAFVQTVLDRNRLLFCDSGFGDLREVHRAEGFRRLVEPRFSPDGSFLLSSSDRGGTFQIFARDACPVENGQDELDLATADLRLHVPLGRHRSRRQFQRGLIGQRYG